MDSEICVTELSACLKSESERCGAVRPGLLIKPPVVELEICEKEIPPEAANTSQPPEGGIHTSY